MFLDHFFNNFRKMPPIKKTPSAVPEHRPLSGDLQTDLHQLTQAIGNPADLVIHRIVNAVEPTQPVVAVVYLNSLTDGPVLGLQVVNPLNQYFTRNNAFLAPGTAAPLLAAAEVAEHGDFHAVTEHLLAGKALLLFSAVGRP